MALWPWGWLSL